MNNVFRVLGLAGVALTVLLVLRDVMSDERAVRPQPIGTPPHDGFPIPLADLGEVELTMIGSSGWTVYDDVELEDGTISRAARWRVTGLDPAPDGEGIGVRDAVMVSLAEDRDGFTLRAPYLWIPTVAGPSGPLPDRTKRWHLDAPVIEVADMFESRAARIVSESAELDPVDDRVYGSGRFTLSSGSLELVGSDLRFDPRTRRADFAPWQGAVAWRLLQPDDGGEVRGKSDGGGFLEPVGEDRARVRMDAAEEVSTVLPASGELRTRDLDLLLATGADGSWVPLRADASAPTRWRDAARLLIGRASSLEFDGKGQPASLEVGGPLRLFPGDGSFDWATARGGAWFDPRAEAVYLFGGFGAQRGTDTVQGGWARLSDGRIRAGGGIWAMGEQGSARAERLRELPDGRWIAEEDARFYPADPQLREVVAPRILFDRDGTFEVLEGFLARGDQDGEPVSFRGRELTSRVHGEGRRTHADGGLRIERPGLRLLADRMRQVGPEHLQLFGRPMQGALALDEGEAQLECGRADWRAGVLTLRRDPRLQVPAAALTLRGVSVTLSAEDMTRDVDGGWRLDQRVRFEGDLEGAGDEASWTPATSVELLGWSEVARLKGTRLDGIAFDVEALKLRVEEPGEFLLEGRAVARLQRPEDATQSVLRGARIAGDLDHAVAEGGASFETPEGSGAARTLSWSRVPELDSYDFHLVGGAWLQRMGMEARGERIDFEAATGDLVVHGDGATPARIRLEDGRTATGTVLRYNERLRIFSGGDVRLTSP